jgi:hypothetical protein
MRDCFGPSRRLKWRDARCLGMSRIERVGDFNRQRQERRAQVWSPPRKRQVALDSDLSG